MKNTLALVAVLLAGTSILVASPLAFGDDQSSGCGIGWQVTNKQSLVGTTTRDTTNYFLPNTFSMTSGTSGCAKHDIVKNDEKAVEYAVNNYDSLIVEMAEGHGEFLAGFAQTLGCGDAAIPEFTSFTQSRYQKILQNSSNDGIQFYKAVRTELQSEPALEAQCIPSA